MPSTFRPPLVEPGHRARDTLAVRALSIAVAGLCAGCLAPPPASPLPAPAVIQVRQWPAGQRFLATVAPGQPDDATARALPGWWRAALGQTVRFSLAEPPGQAHLPRLRLQVARPAQALTASLQEGERVTVLAAQSYAPDSETPDLLAALDRLAWATRLALGEDALPPMPVAAITSRDPRVVATVLDAEQLLRTGGINLAADALFRSRPRDGAAPFLLAPLAELMLLRGDADDAERICREALGYAQRSSPTVQHRLARTLLLARAARSPQQAARYDADLRTLSLVAQRERPHDDEVLWTGAIADLFRAEFAAARPVLERLHERMPERALVAYHLGWACLGTGDYLAACDAFRHAALRLPKPNVLLPYGVALLEAGRHDDLARVLRATRAEYDPDGATALTHQLLRMQAAHAILQNQAERARRYLLDDLRWLLEHPLELDSRVGEFADEGAVLVRLGSAPELPALLASVQRLHPGTAVADACSFVGGLHEVETTGRRLPSVERRLSHDGDSAFAYLLRAYAHERRGEIGDMQNALARAARLSDSPLTKALLAKSLRAVGKLEPAERLHATLRRELRSVHLRQRCRHPLFGPELAYAYVLR